MQVSKIFVGGDICPRLDSKCAAHVATSTRARLLSVNADHCVNFSVLASEEARACVDFLSAIYMAVAVGGLQGLPAIL